MRPFHVYSDKLGRSRRISVHSMLFVVERLCSLGRWAGGHSLGYCLGFTDSALRNLEIGWINFASNKVAPCLDTSDTGCT